MGGHSESSAGQWAQRSGHGAWRTRRQIAVGETIILLHSPLPLLGVSTGMKRGCRQNDSLADGYRRMHCDGQAVHAVQRQGKQPMTRLSFC